MDHETPAELRRQASGALALTGECRVKDFARGNEQSLPLLLVETSERCERRDLGAVEKVVGIAAPNTGHGALIAQDGMDLATIGARANQRGERFGLRLRP